MSTPMERLATFAAAHVVFLGIGYLTKLDTSIGVLLFCFGCGLVFLIEPLTIGKAIQDHNSDIVYRVGGMTYLLGGYGWLLLGLVNGVIPSAVAIAVLVATVALLPFFGTTMVWLVRRYIADLRLNETEQ